MSESLKLAYSAASTYPIKLSLHEKQLLSAKLDKRILPLHVQLNPTNHCNFQCPFCSCDNRDKNLEMPLSVVLSCMKRFRDLGCEAVTITGGGEPLLHRDFNRMIDGIADLGIEIGLVTNGSCFQHISWHNLSKLTWCRISASTILNQQLNRIGRTVEDWLHTIKQVVARTPIDWAFSYVLTKQADFRQIRDLVDFANNHDFTHVRLVNDIFQARELQSRMEELQLYLHVEGTVDRIVNYQAREAWTRGQNPCYISLLKPVVGADGYLYPCCGTQYALATPGRDYEKSMRMAYWKDVDFLYDGQLFFDGSMCVKCYYSRYNEVLGLMLNGIDHAKFV